MNAVETATIVVVADEDGDASYLEQAEFGERREQWLDGGWGFIGLYLEAKVRIPHGKGFILTKVRTPGLWSIESDSEEEYLFSVANDEYWTLAEMLRELNCATPANLDLTIHYR